MFTIGILGATVYNRNLGCQALAWSLIPFLEDIAEKEGFDVRYIIFDRILDERTTADFLESAGVPAEKVRMTYAGTIKLYRVGRNRQFSKELDECDAVIDITQGDSFADIYGRIRFWRYTWEKLLVLRKHIPLILGPQTYGPFDRAGTRRTAVKVMRKAALVMARDEMSADYAEEISGVKAYRGIDLAFLLPFRRDTDRAKAVAGAVGVNVSGLLWETGNAPGSVTVRYRTDYREYIRRLIETLLGRGEEVVLVSHVTDDLPAAREVAALYPRVRMLDEFRNAVEAKETISGLKCLIASRMHATIGAVSAGVPVIPVSYSRKFEGLFSTIGYPCVVSLKEHDTEECLRLTEEALDRLPELKREAEAAGRNASARMDAMKEEMAKTFRGLGL